MAPRPDGIPGLLIDEIELVAIHRASRGLVAQVRGGGKGYMLRENDQVFDGDVLSISRNEVIFKQLTPGAAKPFREVVKTVGGTI